MSLRIAFDLDGVLADMDAELIRQADRLFGEHRRRRAPDPAPAAPPPHGDAAPSSGGETTAGEAGEDSVAYTLSQSFDAQLTDRQQSRLWRHVQAIEGFWESLAECEPGTVARLGALAADRRWEIIFLTRRPETAGASAQVQSQRWLEAHAFTLPSVFVVQGSRGRIASALSLDFVIDDRPENCLDVVADSRARAILVWRGDQGHVPAAVRRLGIGVVASVAECLDVLGQGGRTDKPGVVDRMMRLLGLKQPASV